MRTVESDLQIKCVRWFRLQHRDIARLLFSVPNGGKRGVVTASIMKAEGTVAGVSDLILLVSRSPFHGLCIEMKKPGGCQSPSQKEWQKAVEAQGYRYEVVKSFEGFVGLVSEYLGCNQYPCSR